MSQKYHVDLGGFDIAYERAGDGPPIVLLHGILGDSRDWQPQMEDLANDLAVIAWDAPGCGQSSDPDETSSLEDYIDCLTGLIERIGPMPAHILGLSWGGTFAQEFYRCRPGHVRSLILADTYAGWKGSLPPEVVRERLASCMRESEMSPSEFVPGWIPGLLTDSAPESMRREVEGIMSDFHPVGYRVMARVLADVDTRDLLPEIRVPTLLIWGEDDRRAPVRVGEEMRDNIPGSSMVVLPNAGHLSNVEQPERFNAAVREFCQSISN